MNRDLSLLQQVGDLLNAHSWIEPCNDGWLAVAVEPGTSLQRVIRCPTREAAQRCRDSQVMMEAILNGGAYLQHIKTTS